MNLPLSGYSLLCTDHSNNVKKGRACIYFKGTLALKMIPIPHLNESFVCEVTIGAIGTVYRSASQNSDESEFFLSNIEFLRLDIPNCNPYLTFFGD